MISESRRDFLKRLGAISALFIVSRSSLRILAADEHKPVEFLIVGDSIVWGQGLEEKDKFYSLTADWLREDAFGKHRDVNVKVKAHSGSTLKFHAEEAEKYKKAGRDENYYYKPEINIGFPSIWKQIEVAADEYKAAGNSSGADMIMLTGGITDIGVGKVLDPFGDNKKLPQLIEKYCRDDMFDVLENAAILHPNSLIVVVGYFPMLSPRSSKSRMFNDWLESMSFPRALKPLANNGVIRPLFFNRLGRKGIARSRIWFDESNKNLQTAVNNLNAKFGRRRAVFVRSPITEDASIETPNSLLFKMGKKGVVEDPLYRARSADCDAALPELKRSTGINYPVRLCKVAGLGHPNQAGARAYAEAIKAALSPILR